MQTINNNALAVLQQIMQQRNWHQGIIERRKASMYKTLANEGRLSYALACDILATIGWTKIAEESWAKVKKC